MPLQMINLSRECVNKMEDEVIKLFILERVHSFHDRVFFGFKNYSRVLFVASGVLTPVIHIDWCLFNMIAINDSSVLNI